MENLEEVCVRLFARTEQVACYMELGEGCAASPRMLNVRLMFSHPLCVIQSTRRGAVAGPPPQILDDPGGTLPYPRASYVAYGLPTLLCRTKSN